MRNTVVLQALVMQQAHVMQQGRKHFILHASLQLHCHTSILKGQIEYLVQEGVCDAAAIEGSDALVVCVAESGDGAHIQVLWHHRSGQLGVQEIDADTGELHLDDRHKRVHHGLQLCHLWKVLDSAQPCHVTVSHTERSIEAPLLEKETCMFYGLTAICMRDVQADFLPGLQEDRRTW